MVVLPDPPPTLPPAPLAFYEELRAVVAELRPADVDPARMEIDFGDGGVAVTLPHRREEDWTVAAQVSRAAAIVFAGPVTEHFTAASGPGWTSAAVALVRRALAGELEGTVSYRGEELVDVGGSRGWGPGAPAFWRRGRGEVVRIDFGATPS